MEEIALVGRGYWMGMKGGGRGRSEAGVGLARNVIDVEKH